MEGGCAERDALNFNTDQENNGLTSDMNSLLWKKKFVNSTTPDTTSETIQTDIVCTILYHKDESNEVSPSRVVFGPFLRGNKEEISAFT